MKPNPTYLIRYLICISIFLFLQVSCENKGNLPVLKLKKGFKGEINIKNMFVIGPFLRDSTKTSESNTLDFNDLSYFGLREDSLSEKDFSTINSKTAKNKKFLHRQFRSEILEIPADNIDFIHLIDTPNTPRIETNFYLANIIKSDCDQEVIYMASTCYGMRLWLNNRLVQHETGITAFPKGFDYYMVLHLKKGENLLTVKVTRGTNHLCWRLVSKIGDIETAKREFEVNTFTDFIINPIVKNGQNLNLYVGGYLGDEKIGIDILDKIDQKKTYGQIYANADNNGYCNFNVSHLPDDFYKCRLVLPEDTFCENFYLGDISKLYAQYKSEIKCLKTDNKQDLVSLTGTLSRFNYLLEKEQRLHSKSEIQFNDKNMLITAYSIRNILENAKTNETQLYKNAKGTYLRAYESKIDDTYQFYMFHASAKILLQEKVPLVVVMPFFHDPLDSLLKSWYISNTDQIEWESRLADENGFALLWPYLRGNSNTSAISTTDFFEAFEDVKKNYTIDPDRVFLMGDCLGATRSLMLAAKYPQLFAGISLFQLEVAANYESDKPMNFVANLSNIPIYIYHSEKDEITPVKNSDDFVAEAGKSNFRIQYDRSNKDSHYLLPKDCHKPIFEFFKNKSRVHKPDTIYYTTFEQKYNKAYWIEFEKYMYPGKSMLDASYNALENKIYVTTANISQYIILTKELGLTKGKKLQVFANGKLYYTGIIKDTVRVTFGKIEDSVLAKNKTIEGPISDFFSDKFVFIKPKNGVTIADKIERKWGDKVFFSVNTVNEDNYTNYLRNSNLILFSNKYTNTAIRDLISKLPFTYTEANSSLHFRNEIIQGKSHFCFIYPNPLNTEKYILYFGTNDPENFELVTTNQLIFGNNDYLIWRNQSGEIQIIEEGCFDMEWK